MTEPTLIPIRLLGFPVQLWLLAQQHTDELLREFALLAEQARHADAPDRSLPTRLTHLVTEMTETYAGYGDEQEQQLFDAAAAGVELVDLDYAVPPTVGVAAVHLTQLLSEADDYCAAGRHLLTLASPPESVMFREWFLSEFTAQAAGQEPISWADYQQNRPPSL